MNKPQSPHLSPPGSLVRRSGELASSVSSPVMRSRTSSWIVTRLSTITTTTITTSITYHPDFLLSSALCLRKLRSDSKSKQQFNPCIPIPSHYIDSRTAKDRIISEIETDFQCSGCSCLREALSYAFFFLFSFSFVVTIYCVLCGKVG